MVVKELDRLTADFHAFFYPPATSVDRLCIALYNRQQTGIKHNIRFDW